MHHPTLCAVVAAVLAAVPGAQAGTGFYNKGSPVIQVDGKSYQNLIAKSNYTTILEFYAPWCGHCQNLKPAYEKAAKNLEGLAKVAAIDCDDESNKPFCGSMGIKGFPTLKIVRPGKKAGKPMVEDYQGPRTAAGIVDAVVEKINNHVKRVTDKDLDDFLSKSEGPKALLFTDKGTVSALLKSVAIDFLDVISVGQIRNKESAAVERFGVDKFPTLVLVPGDGGDPIKYDGPVKKADMVKFLSQAGAPNPDTAPAAAGGKKPEKKSAKKSEKKSESKEKKNAKASPEPEEKASTSEPESTATETVKQPVIVETPIPIPTLHTAEKLAAECLHERGNTCLLAFYPGEAVAQAEGEKIASLKHEGAQKVLGALSHLAFNYAKAERAVFPIFAVPASNPGGAAVLSALGLTGEVELVAINPRRGWYKLYTGEDVSQEAIESWVDAIRMGEGAKNKIPEGVIPTAAAEETPAAEKEAEKEATSSEETKATDPTPEPETAAEPEGTAAAAKDVHDEL